MVVSSTEVTNDSPSLAFCCASSLTASTLDLLTDVTSLICSTLVIVYVLIHKLKVLHQIILLIKCADSKLAVTSLAVDMELATALAMVVTATKITMASNVQHVRPLLF